LKLTCGVALCTYNGGKYLKEQLESILSQTKQPDAIVICDDCSTDDTWDILNRFKLSAPVSVKLMRNATQQGVTKNFELAVQSLETDLIFLCDQDDIWFVNKISTIHAVFLASPKTEMVFTNAVLVDANGNDLGATLFGELQLSQEEEQALARGKAFEVLCRRNVITGATAAFRRSLLSVALPFSDTCLHDEWLGLIASTLGGVVQLPDCTIKYRQHGKNVVGVRKLSRLEIAKELWWSIQRFGSRKFAEDRIRYRVGLLDRIKDHPQICRSFIERCQDSVVFAEFRAALPERFFMRWPAVFLRVIKGEYRRFGYWWKSDIFRDLIHK
jgi:glycosyltransferase involved in cell wall biosynthesis